MNKFFRSSVLPIILLIIPFTHTITAQPVSIQSSSEIKLALEKLEVLGSVLYLGAHPDDENTAVIAYMSKGKKYRTAYLSLTRGDGGQNLIGSEKGSEIGILRTQELLEARNIDGGEQYFTRAIDFGYSKSPEEALEIWGKEDVLADVVWVIRNFKPDIIITRFPPGGNGGHGHHTASAALAKEAFTAAADPNQFPEQLKYVQPWQTKRLFWNNWRPGQNEIEGLFSADVGDYNPLLGKSYSEIAAESRSMHKSQGFGVSAYRGSRTEYFQYIIGDKPAKDIMDGVNTTWGRINNGVALGNKIETILKSFNHDDPSKSLDALVSLYGDMEKLGNNYWVDVKKKELLEIIRSCAGLWMESIATDYSAAPGDNIKLRTLLVNRSPNKFELEKVEFPTITNETAVNQKLKFNDQVNVDSEIKIPDSYPISQPYWLVKNPSKGLFEVDDQTKIGMAENSPSIPVKIILSYGDQKLVYTIPLLYRWNDKVEGELYRPFEIRPPVTADLTDMVSVFPDNNPKVMHVKMSNNSPNVKGIVTIHDSGNWKIEPASIPFEFKNKYEEKVISFKVTPPANANVSDLKIETTANGKTFEKAMVEIAHPHINHQVYFPDSDIKLVKLNIKKFDENIGYITGSGDDIPDCLRNLGYKVTLLSDEMLDAGDLSQFDVIIAGIRAYNTRERLKYDQPRLMDFVKNGGTYIVQYNVQRGLVTDDIGPYPINLSGDRITVEESPVTFTNPNTQLLNFPNKITQKDFDGWIQERGTYFADKWDPQYETVLAGHDPGESDLKGGMLFAKYGKGDFIFSGYAWFRQLPAGVPGSYRIFVNMISAGKYGEKQPN